MEKNSGSRQNINSKNNNLSNQILNMIFKDKPLLTAKQKADLDSWLKNYKHKRFGKQGFESWLADHNND